MSKLMVGFWSAWEVNTPERNKLPAATPTARNTVAAVTIIRILIIDPPDWACCLVYPAFVHPQTAAGRIQSG